MRQSLSRPSHGRRSGVEAAGKAAAAALAEGEVATLGPTVTSVLGREGAAGAFFPLPALGRRGSQSAFFRAPLTACSMGFYIVERSVPGLNEVGLNCFWDLVYHEVNANVRVAITGLINKEREGEQIDRALLKNVIDIFVEIGKGQMEAYEEDFEAHMLIDTGKHYSRKASSWVLENPYTDYISNADECLRRERDRASHYLHSSSEKKLVKKVQHELVVVYATQLLEKERSDSGCSGFPRDINVEDLFI